MRICGLDVASTTGFCIATGSTYQTGSFDCRKVGKRKVETDAERNANFRNWLYSFLRAHEVQAVAIERRGVSNMKRKVRDKKTGKMIEVDATNDASAATLAYLNNCAQEVCFSLNIPFELVAVQTWRSVFLKGQEPRKKTIKSKGEEKVVDEDAKDLAVRVCKLLKIEARSADAAEAVGIAFWFQGKLKLQRAQAPAGGLFAESEAE
jgi:hypothetical protein